MEMDFITLTQLSQVKEIKAIYKRPSIAGTIKIKQSGHAADLARSIYAFNDDNPDLSEYFYCLYLDRANNVLTFKRISEGGVSGTVADPKKILQFALLSNASCLILVHNHPSGNVQPSEPDILLTRKIKQAANTMDMILLDHVIISAEGFYSFADNGNI